MFRTLFILALTLFVAYPARAAEESADVPAGLSEERPFADLEETFNERQKQLMQEFQAWYDRSREAGEKGRDWIIKDIKNIGDWEYLVVTLQADDEEDLSRQLNKYGQDRWEAYWVQKKIHGIQFFFKRPVRTYIKHIPVGDLLHMMPEASKINQP